MVFVVVVFSSICVLDMCFRMDFELVEMRGETCVF